jgi:hypothetical protein
MCTAFLDYPKQLKSLTFLLKKNIQSQTILKLNTNRTIGKKHYPKEKEKKKQKKGKSFEIGRKEKEKDRKEKDLFHFALNAYDKIFFNIFFSYLFLFSQNRKIFLHFFLFLSVSHLVAFLSDKSCFG